MIFFYYIYNLSQLLILNTCLVYTRNGQTLSNKDILLTGHFYRDIDSNPLGPTLPSDMFAGFSKMDIL